MPPPNRPTRRVARAFTLIELLVVISIIAVLVGILLPALTQARKMGRDAQCQSNLRNIFIASQAYGDDSKEKFPGTFTLGGWSVRIAPGTVMPDSAPSFAGQGPEGQTKNTFPGFFMGLNDLLDWGGYMAGQSPGWVCPANIPEMAETGNTYGWPTDLRFFQNPTIDPYNISKYWDLKNAKGDRFAQPSERSWVFDNFTVGHGRPNNPTPGGFFALPQTWGSRYELGKLHLVDTRSTNPADSRFYAFFDGHVGPGGQSN